MQSALIIRYNSSMGNIKPKLKDGSYHPPETIGLVYCVAVLEIVLKEHPNAKELYEDIKDCLLLPGVQETFNKHIILVKILSNLRLGEPRYGAAVYEVSGVGGEFEAV